jgi:hypothetical protein
MLVPSLTSKPQSRADHSKDPFAVAAIFFCSCKSSGVTSLSSKTLATEAAQRGPPKAVSCHRHLLATGSQNNVLIKFSQQSSKSSRLRRAVIFRTAARDSAHIRFRPQAVLDKSSPRQGRRSK